MSLLAVIPARLGATRLPRKPLRLLGGQPLVVRVWERVRDLAVADRVVVATDSAEVLDAVRAAGAEAVLTRADHPSGTDRVAEVAARTEYAAHSAVLNVQGDEPFASAEALTAASGLVTSGAFAVGTASCAADVDALGRPDDVKVVAADDGRALLFSRAPIPWLREPGADGDRAAHAGLVRRHVGVYAYTREALLRWVALPVHPLERVERLEQLRPLAHGIAIGVARLTTSSPSGIDTEDDLRAAERAWPAWESARHAARHAPRGVAANAVATGAGADQPYAVPSASSRPRPLA